MPTHIIKHSIRHRLTPLALVAKIFSLQLKRGQAGPKHVLLLNVKYIDLKKLLFMFTNFNCDKCDSTLINKECLKVHIDKQHEKEGIQPIDNLVIRMINSRLKNKKSQLEITYSIHPNMVRRHGAIIVKFSLP